MCPVVINQAIHTLGIQLVEEIVLCASNRCSYIPIVALTTTFCVQVTDARPTAYSLRTGCIYSMCMHSCIPRDRPARYILWCTCSHRQWWLLRVILPSVYVVYIYTVSWAVVKEWLSSTALYTTTSPAHFSLCGQKYSEIWATPHLKLRLLFKCSFSSALFGNFHPLYMWLTICTWAKWAVMLSTFDCVCIYCTHTCMCACIYIYVAPNITNLVYCVYCVCYY